MNVDKDLLYFNLNQLDNRLGYEKSRSAPADVNGITCVTIVIVINTYFDLVQDRPVEFSLTVPVNYHLNGGIVVQTADNYATAFLRSLKPCPLDEHAEVVLVGMNRVKYPFAVWFYAIRELFKVQRAKLWGSAILLREEFQCINLDWPVYSQSSQLKLFCGSGRTRGRRDYMEDVDLVYNALQLNERRAISVFGVLDGHGGKDCAQFCSEDIPVRIAANMRNGCSCPEALYNAFLDSDTEYLDSPSCGGAGSTANVAVYDRNYNVFYAANTGDTRAVISRRGVALDLSYDRKGSDAEEMARVARAGGFVVKGRLMGTLAVSRALGDISLKEQGTQGLQRVLIPDPELSAFYPTSADDFLLIATDGLWDVMSSQAAVDHARTLLTQEGLLGPAAVDIETVGEEVVSTRLSQVANNMAVHAVSNLNSQDNVTVLIILLCGGPAGYPPAFVNRQPLLKAAPASVEAGGKSTYSYSARTDVKNDREEKVPFSSRGIGSEIDSISSLVEDTTEASEWTRPTVVFRQTSVPPSYSSGGGSGYSSNGANEGYQSSLKVMSGAAAASSKAATAADSELDDMMDFLNDDSNF